MSAETFPDDTPAGSLSYAFASRDHIVNVQSSPAGLEVMGILDQHCDALVETIRLAQELSTASSIADDTMKVARIVEWSLAMKPEDMSLGGLARLENELFRPYPETQAAVAEVVSDFVPLARDIETRHGGRALMAPLRARQNQNWRASPNFALGCLSFLIILLPACALGILVRGTWDSQGVIWTVAILLALTALVCVIKVFTTLRDRVWTGVMRRWSSGAAITCVLILIGALFLINQVPIKDSGAASAVMAGSSAVIVGFAALNVYRGVSSRQAITAEFAAIQPRIDSYLSEFSPKYLEAMMRIRDALGTLNTLNPNLPAKLLRERNNAVGTLESSGGLCQGNVPPFISKKELGEFALLAIAEPLLGGMSYPIWGNPARGVFAAPPG